MDRADVDEIIEDHLRNGRIVDPLRIRVILAMSATSYIVQPATSRRSTPTRATTAAAMR